MKKDLDIWQKIFKGIENEKHAFSGPHTVQIDLTDKCNNACIGCWVHSPLVDKKEVFPQGKKELPFKLVKKLIEELYHLGTKEIILSGSGEPLMYPHIDEVIALIKSKGMHLNIITNATILNEKISKILVERKVDLITASIWAGSPQTYIDTHLDKNRTDFEIVKENLKRLTFYKQHSNSLCPQVKIYNVLCSKNFNDIEAMVDFTLDVRAEFIEFQILDIIPGITEDLALNKSSRKNILASFDRISRRKNLIKWEYGSAGSLGKEDVRDFGKIWRNYNHNFTLLERGKNIVCIKGEVCKKGEVVKKTIPPGDEQYLLFRFFFEENRCKKCAHFGHCFPSKECIVEVKLLNFLGIESFLRRLSSFQVELGIYEKQLTSLPCYIGWYYARILTNGDVIPCCKASLHSLGNIYKNTFSKIWNSPAYKEFRFKAKNLPKSDPYFSKINCIKSCDNWGMNLEIIERLWLSSRSAILSDAEQDGKRIEILAKDFIEGNVNPGYHGFGEGLIIDGGTGHGFVRYEFKIMDDGYFELWSRYTSGKYRPVNIYIDDQLMKKDALGGITGGWTSQYLKWYKECTIKLQQGKHTLKICSSQYIPHIERVIFLKKATKPDFLDKQEKSSYFKTITQNTSKRGFNETLLKIAHNLTPRNLKDRYLEILGTYDGEYGYKGPFHVQIDLTNNCNNNCIACWCNSPLLKEKRLSELEKKQYLPFEMAKELLDEVTRMGATEIYYSGSGEPFMHPQIMEILEYTKRKKLVCHVNTNFSLFNKEKLDHLIKIGVDYLTVSTWSATADTYVKTHPNKTENDFNKIKENLLHLNSHKKDKPLIKLYNVLFSMNYFELEKMVDFASQTKSESLEFTLVDTIPNATDTLALTNEQFVNLRQLSEKIKLKLDKKSKVKENGVLIFQFDQFLRRISDAGCVKEAKYDRNIIDQMPCYIGWLFARIIPNGEVHSCLKAHRIPTGSLYLNRFSEIWNSEKQVYFRKKSLVCEKSDPFFTLIGNDPTITEAGCYKSCDDIGRNTWMHKRVGMLSLPERVTVKGIAKTLKIARKLKPKKEDYGKYHQDHQIAGILHGRKAFLGPEQVVIDPTNKCNLRCISCWLYSPLLKENRPSVKWLRKELPKDTLIKLIDDLASLGTKRIRFTGGGEPFMYKDLLEIIEYARKKQLLIALTTNFGLVPREDIKRLIDLGLDELCVSIWASNSKTYNIVHPGTASVYFEKLKENLLYLKEIKKDLPRVTFANVIMNANFGDFEEMYEFGLQYGADALYFTIVDVFSGQTDKFLMNEEERKDVLEKALKIKERAKRDRIQLEFFDGFLRRISKTDEDFLKGEYDKFDIDKIPCYVGWVYSRILADGSAVPCCRGVKKIMGNINRKSFKEIWFSSKYNEFRARAKYQKKDTPYFKDIGCIKECDNLMHNENVHRKIYDKKGGDD